MIGNFHIGKMNLLKIKKIKEKTKRRRKNFLPTPCIFLFLPEVTIDNNLVCIYGEMSLSVRQGLFMDILIQSILSRPSGSFNYYSFIQQLFIDLLIKCQAQFLESWYINEQNMQWFPLSCVSYFMKKLFRKRHRHSGDREQILNFNDSIFCLIEFYSGGICRYRWQAHNNDIVYYLGISKYIWFMN